jgi:hypothetical protein
VKRSGTQEHALAQQIEVGTPVHLPFDTLELIYLALGLSTAMFSLSSGSDSIIVAVDPGDKAFEFRDTRDLGLVEPTGKNAYLPLRRL